MDKRGQHVGKRSKSFYRAFLSKEKHFSGQLLSFTVKDPCDQKIRKNKERNKQTNKKEEKGDRFDSQY